MYRSIAIVFFLGILISCQPKDEGIYPIHRDLTQAIYSTATVAPKEFYTVFAPVSGIIESSYLDEGKSIEKNATLLKIKNLQSDLNSKNAKLNFDIARETYSGDATLLKELEESIATVRLRIKNDSLLYKRQQRLWDQNIGSLQNLESRKLAFETAKLELTKLTNNYSRTKKELDRKMQQADNAYRISEINRKEFLIKSKLTGTIYEVFKEVGEAISPQTPLATIGSNDDYIVSILIDEVDISQVLEGQDLVISLEAYPDQTFPGKIDRILPSKDMRSQTFTIEASFIKRPKKLYKGLSGEANIILSESRKVLTVPSNYINENSEVKTIDGLIKIEEGIKNLSFTEVLSGIDSSTIIYSLE